MVTYSVVAPVYNERETLPHFYRRVIAVMEQLGEPFEVILVNDGSTDDSLEIMRQIHEQDPRVKVISLSRNFGHQIVITAGLDVADGDAVVVMDSDLQDPPEVIPELVAEWKRGYEVVFAVRAERQGETAFKLATAKLFYRVLSRITAVNIPHDTGDFRLMDRRAVMAMRRLHEHHRFMRGLSAWIGFRQTGVKYVRQVRFAGTTMYPFNKMLRLAIDATTSFSYVPLQLATSVGFGIAALSVIGIILTFILRLANRTVAGQATTLVAVLFLGGIQLIFLGVLGEYLGRIYDEVKGRPLYLIDEMLGFAGREPDTARRRPLEAASKAAVAGLPEDAPQSDRVDVDGVAPHGPAVGGVSECAPQGGLTSLGEIATPGPGNVSVREGATQGDRTAMDWIAHPGQEAESELGGAPHGDLTASDGIATPDRETGHAPEGAPHSSPAMRPQTPTPSTIIPSSSDEHPGQARSQSEPRVQDIA